MAARLAPENVRRTHQSLHHLVAEAPWDDEEMLAQVRGQVLPAMQKNGAVVAWIVDDTGFPKQGKHSVGVARQYCGQIGKHDNCQAAVSLSVSTWGASLPIAWRLYLPEVWCKDAERCRQAGVPEEIAFQTKPEIAVEQVRRALEQKIPVGVVLADAGYGNGTAFRTAITELGLQYAVGIESSTTVWEPGKQPLPAPAPKPGSRGLPPKRLQRSADHQPSSVKELALLAAYSLEGNRLAPRKSGSPALSFRGGPRASGASRLQAYRAPPRGMAFDRMAEEGIGTDQILVFHFAGENVAEVAGEDGQTPLDHRTRL
jgi:SRSO17 transposase